MGQSLPRLSEFLREGSPAIYLKADELPSGSPSVSEYRGVRSVSELTMSNLGDSSLACACVERLSIQTSANVKRIGEKEKWREEAE